MHKNPKNKQNSEKIFSRGLRNALWHGFGLCNRTFENAPVMPKIAILSDDGLLRRMLSLSLAGLPIDVGCGSCRSVGGTLLSDADLMILMQTAPFYSGGEICRRLQRRERWQRLYVIAWQQSEQAVLSLLESGVDQYLTFPLSLQRLRLKVARELLGGI